MSWVNTRLRDMAFAAARQGLAFDVAWSSDLVGRNSGCVIPDGPTIRDKPRAASDAVPAPRGSWKNKFAKYVPPAPAPTKEDTSAMDIDTLSELQDYLKTVLDDAQMQRVGEIIGNAPDLATDSLRQRVAQGVSQQRVATEARLASRFPNMRRLAG